MIIEVNLIEKRKRKSTTKVMGMDLGEVNWVLNGVIVVIFLMGSFFLDDYLAKEKESLVNEQNILESRIGKLRTFLRQNRDIKDKLKKHKEKIRILEQRQGLVDQILALKRSPEKLFEKIARSIPEDAWLITMSLKGDDLFIKAGSDSYDSISEFIKSMDNTPYFKEKLVIKKQNSEKEFFAGKEYRVETFELFGKVDILPTWGRK